MTVDGWWGVLLDGAIGAALTLFGALLIFWLTRWRDRKSNAKNLALTGVAEVMEVVLQLRGVPTGPDEDEILAKLQDTLLLFYVRVVSEFPKAADWALMQEHNIANLSEKNADVRSARNYAADVVAPLGEWVRVRFKSSAFKKSGMSEEVPSTWLPDGADPSVSLTRDELSDLTPDVLAKIEKLNLRIDPEVLRRAHEVVESSSASVSEAR
ncbi:hypothetical protein [Kocuria sabuli]|uniref:hypothetical protein n=1 Tax=Kocuria sabuli TaxID=3071448 RepID=UPI0034D6FA91